MRIFGVKETDGCNRSRQRIMQPRARIGRPPRKKPSAKLNLLVAKESKRHAFTLASERGISIGRLFEFLIEAAHARAFSNHQAARRRR
jgi:predicted HicB family RNase H-like nuclease